VLSAAASCGGLATPPVFTTNQSGDDTFLATLNVLASRLSTR
jgi:hypothetical protein